MSHAAAQAALIARNAGSSRTSSLDDVFDGVPRGGARTDDPEQAVEPDSADRSVGQVGWAVQEGAH